MNDYSIEQLINIPQLESLLEAHTRISGMACGLMDNDLNIIVGVGLQQVCARFLWEHPESFARCWRNDPAISQTMHAAHGDLFACHCKSGMVSSTLPIIIAGAHLGVFFSGQFFYDDQPPDLARFQSQAEELGFEVDAYLAAVRKVPLLSRVQVDATMFFLHQLVQLLAETGYSNLIRLREQQERKQLVQELSVLSTAINHADDAFFLIDGQQRFKYVNTAACRSLGYSRDELLGLTTFDVDPDITPAALAEMKKQLEQGVSFTVESCHLTKDGKRFPVEISGTSFEYDGNRLGLITARNITERKKTDQELKLLNFAFEHVREGIFLAELAEGRFVYVNQEACRSLEYSRDELIGKSALDIDPNYCPEMLHQTIANLHSQGSVTIESHHRTRTGRVFPVELTVTLFEYEGMKFALCLARNIAARTKMMQALKESEERFQLLTELSPDLIFIRHGEEIIYANPAAARTVGAPSSLDLIGRSLLDFGLPKHRERFNTLIETNSSKPSGTITPPFEEILVRLDGTQIVVEITSVRFQYRGMPCSQVIMRDITERKRAEQQIKLLSHAIDQASEGVFLIDAEGRFIYVNQEACRSLGYSNQELTGMSIPDINTDCTHEQALAHVKTVQSLQALTFEVSHRTRSGEVFPVEISSSNFEYNGSRYILSLAKDISERKQVEQELNQKQQNLKELALELALSGERERRQIAAELHDTLGQDLALARMKLGALYKTDLLPDQRLFLTEAKGLIKNAISRIRSFTRQLYPPILESAGLEAALECLVYQLETDYNLKISFYDDSLEKNVPREWQIELYNSVRELLINVAKHAGTTSACLSICRQTDELEICVVDYGAGFDADKALSNPDIDGFGLFTIKSRIMYMNGSFQISSTYGVGTEVIIMVPLKCT